MQLFTDLTSDGLLSEPRALATGQSPLCDEFRSSDRFGGRERPTKRRHGPRAQRVKFIGHSCRAPATRRVSRLSTETFLPVEFFEPRLQSVSNVTQPGFVGDLAAVVSRHVKHVHNLIEMRVDLRQID